MQDRFKFRVWGKPTGQMFYDVALGFIKAPLCEDWVCVDTPEGQMSYTGLRLKDIEIMQCTGLKDKNGKMIFEGDICKNIKNGEIVSAAWHGTMAGFVWSKPKYAQINDFGALFRAYDKYEVIGNIYEQPELLEVKE